MQVIVWRIRWAAVVVLVVSLCATSAASATSGTGSSRGATSATNPFAGSGWCGTKETAKDRPNVQGGAQIHIAYAYPSNGVDRFAEWLPKIIGTLGAVDQWWRGQDPIRTPRFDLAPFPGCGATLAALDISSVKVDAVGRALARLLPIYPGLASGSTETSLVFYDGPTKGNKCGEALQGDAVVYLQPAAGVGCTFGGFGTINGWPAAVTAHEIIHALTLFVSAASTLPPPHACADRIHVCDDRYDIMTPGGDATSATSLAQTVMDARHDDYFQELHDSPFLVHLDAQSVLGIVVSPLGGGGVHEENVHLVCPSVCTSIWDNGAHLYLTAHPARGFAFAGWAGACGRSDSACIVTLSGPTQLTATFVRAQRIRVWVRGHGGVLTPTGTCERLCTLSVVPGAKLTIYATAGPHAHFDHWEGDCKGSKARCTIGSSPGVSLAAVFKDD